MYNVKVPAASATLDSFPKGCCQLLTDSDELRNRFHDILCVLSPVSVHIPVVAVVLLCFRPSSSGFFWMAGTAGGTDIFIGYSPVMQNW